MKGKSCICNVHAFDMIFLSFDENCNLDALNDDMLWFGFVPPFLIFNVTYCCHEYDMMPC